MPEVLPAQVFRYPQPAAARNAEFPPGTRVDTIVQPNGTIVVIHVVPGTMRPDTVSISPVMASGSDDAGTELRMLTEGNVGMRGSSPAVGLTLIEFYIAPDIKTWNWSIPIILISSNSIGTSASDPKRVAADLLDAFSGALNGSITQHIEWRGEREDGRPSITGLYLDFGAIGKVNPVGSGTSTYMATLGPHARLDGRITTKTNKSSSDYSGVLHARLSLTGNYLLSNSQPTKAVFGALDFNHATAMEISLGWFPVSAASINIVTYSTAFGNLPPEFKNRWSTGLSIFPK